jgi:hypothetical protein
MQSRVRVFTLCLPLAFSGIPTEAASVKQCLAESGKSYYSDHCKSDTMVANIALGEITRLDPAPEKPLTGLWGYYEPFYLKFIIKLRELDIINRGR